MFRKEANSRSPGPWTCFFCSIIIKTGAYPVVEWGTFCVCPVVEWGTFFVSLVCSCEYLQKLFRTVGCLTVVLSCSGMWRRVSGSVISDVSKESSVFIYRVKEFCFKVSEEQLNFLDFSTLEYDATTFLPNVGSH